MILEFTEQEQIAYLSRRGYEISVKTEIQYYGPEEIEVPKRIATKGGTTEDLDRAFRREIKRSILER